MTVPPFALPPDPMIDIAPTTIMPRIALIVAVADNGVIGRDGGMPWRQSSDLRRFKALTVGKPVIMGRKTWQSLGRPLPDRLNVVVTRDPSFTADGAVVTGSFEAALDIARSRARRDGVDEIMVIGGAELYRLAWSLARRIYLTRVHARPDGDTSFDAASLAELAGGTLWSMVSSEDVAAGDRDDHAVTFQVFDRV